VGLLHQLRPAGTPVAIVIPQLAAQLPGLREQLEQFRRLRVGERSLTDSRQPRRRYSTCPNRRQMTQRFACCDGLPLAAPANGVTRESLGQRRFAAPPHPTPCGTAVPTH